MLREVLKFSHRIPVDEVGAAAGGIGIALAGCRREPAASMSQTPPANISSNRKYGK